MLNAFKHISCPLVFPFSTVFNSIHYPIYWLDLFSLGRAILIFAVLYLLYLLTTFDICKHFLPCYRLPLLFSDSFLCCAEGFKFHVIPFVSYQDSFQYYWSPFKKVLTYNCVLEYCHMFSFKIFKISGLILMSFIFLGLIFVQRENYESNFFHLYVDTKPFYYQLL